MSGISRWRRRESPAVRAEGGRSKAATALTAVGDVAKETATESARTGISKVGDKVGKYAGAGLGLVAGTTLNAVGVNAPSWVPVGTAYVGAQVGGFTQKVMNRVVDKVSQRGDAGGGAGGTGAVGTTFEQLASVVRLAEAARNDVVTAIRSVNACHDQLQRLTGEASSELVASAVQRCLGARQLLNDGIEAVAGAESLIREYGDSVLYGKT